MYIRLLFLDAPNGDCDRTRGIGGNDRPTPNTPSAAPPPPPIGVREEAASASVFNDGNRRNSDDAIIAGDAPPKSSSISAATALPVGIDAGLSMSVCVVGAVDIGAPAGIDDGGSAAERLVIGDGGLSRFWRATAPVADNGVLAEPLALGNAGLVDAALSSATLATLVVPVVTLLLLLAADTEVSLATAVGIGVSSAAADVGALPLPPAADIDDNTSAPPPDNDEDVTSVCDVAMATRGLTTGEPASSLMPANSDIDSSSKSGSTASLSVTSVGHWRGVSDGAEAADTTAAAGISGKSNARKNWSIVGTLSGKKHCKANEEQRREKISNGDQSKSILEPFQIC